MKLFYIDYRCLLYNGVAAKLLSLKPRTFVFFPLHGPTIVRRYNINCDLLLLCNHTISATFHLRFQVVEV